jgi:hypothetical protein
MIPANEELRALPQARERDMKAICRSARRAAKWTGAAVMSGVLFCVVAQGADAASGRVPFGGTFETVTKPARTALEHEPIHVNTTGTVATAPVGGIKGESAEEKHKGGIE